MDAVVGRDAELAAIDEFLTGLESGPRALMLEGEPGIGKTTVWREAVRRAEERGFLVLACRPAESEAKLSFSALADLLEPLPGDALDGLPEPQRYALEVALLRVSPGEKPPDRRAIAAGFRSVLTAASGERPIMLAIDDAQWLDTPSAAAIEFTLRRSSGTIVLLGARRPGDALKAAVGDAEPVRLGPLSVAAIHHVIVHELDSTLPRPLLTRVHETADGNPFFALEIARLALETERQPGEPLPVPDDLSQLVLQRVERLDADTRDVLLTASSVATPTRALLADLHDDVGRSLEEAEAAGIVVAAESTVRFAHPLYAAAVYGSSTTERRRRLHGTLAERVEQPEERARHLALATTEEDEAIAAELHAAAKEAVTRGAPATGAELVEHALRIGTPGAEAERLVDLAHYLHWSGDTHRALAIVEDVAARPEVPAPALARAYSMLLEATYWTKGSIAATELGEQGLEAADAPEVTAALHAQIAVYCEHDLDRAFRHAEDAVALFEPMGEDANGEFFALALSGKARNQLALGRGLERELVERAMEVDPGSLAAHQYGQWLKYVDDFDESRRRLETSLDEAERDGDETSVPNILQQLAMTECWSGHLGRARELAARAFRLAEELGIASVGPRRTLAIVEAHLGNEPQVRSLAAELRSEGWGPELLQVEIALALLELSLANFAEADEHARAAVKAAEDASQLEPGIHRVHGDAAEAALAVGDLERAEALATFLAEHGRRTGHAWSVAVGARSRALVEAEEGDLDDALAAVDEALGAQERLAMPYELGRTLLVKGQIERRGKRRREAKDSLERAQAIFEELGAALWAGRAAAELRRIPIKRGASGDLTDGEARVAELAASGMTNKEVAQALFISPKTVEANLSRIYTKLGIRSRAELGARMGERSAKT